MKNFLKNIFLITIPTIVVFLLISELFFRTIIPAANNPFGYFDEDNLIYKLCPNKDGLYTMGKFAQQKAKWRINNDGWNSPIDYKREKNRKRIAIIGDSYIEAFQVDSDKSYPSLLRKKLGDKFDVYSFGKSGAPLSQYLNISRYVNNYFKPDILIFNIVHNDFDESITCLNPNDIEILTLNMSDSLISEKAPRPNYSFQQYNWKKRTLMKSALIRYLFMNLGAKSTILSTIENIKKPFIKNTEDTKKIFNANVEVNNLLLNIELIEKATGYIFKKIKKENTNKRIIFVMDAPRFNIYKNTLDNSNVLFLHRMMDSLCKKYNFEFLDLTQPMVKDYNLNHIKFESKYDGHWNEYGHKFVCEQVFKILKKHYPNFEYN